MTDSSKDRTGQQLGNYRLLRLLGRGGFAEVYLGEHLYLKSYAALKILHTTLDGEDAAKFVQEAQTLARLSHPHITRVLDFAVADGVPFLVMEYAPKGTLRQRHPRGTRLSPSVIVSYVQQVASALQYAHDQRLIHRDIKPENMLLNPQDEVVLGDFGLALLIPHTLSLSTQAVAHAVAGTPLYLAPEQLQGQPKPSSDQYALGVVVYEWLCGKTPFRGSFIEIATQHLSTSPPSLHEQVPDLAPAIEEVVLQALAKEPQQRFSRVQDFATALARACSSTASRLSLPSPTKESLMQQQDQPTLATSSSPACAESTTIHRVQQDTDTPKPEPIWKVPTPLTPLIGREQELATVCTLLERPEVRLLTLLGPGGIGKSRLSLQLATVLRNQFSDGICFVPLSTIIDPEMVVAKIAQELGLREMGERSLVEQLKIYLRNKHFLLLLDNFEQVTAAATEVEELLTVCPALKIIVSSRAVLHLQAEYTFPVPPLTTPTWQQLAENEALTNYTAIALFCQRAQTILPTFQVTPTNARTIAEICIRLDGLPLAIELAAARIKLLPPQALLARLSQRLQLLTSGSRTLPARQQTLRNTIQWSYDLLDAQEQKLFRQLSIFVGGCTLETVEVVCHDIGNGTSDILDVVASLIDKSLIQQTEQEGEEPRFVMLETIREYGLERLQEQGEAEASQKAHAEYYLTWAQKVEPRLKGGGQQALWLTRLNQEQENLRAALQWFIEQKHVESALRLSGALGLYWHMRTYYKEGLQWLEATLQLAQTREQTTARAKVLYSAGVLHAYQGNRARAQTLIEESIIIYQKLEDKRGLAEVLVYLGATLYLQNDYTAARSLLEQSIALSRVTGDKWTFAAGLNELAHVMRQQGDDKTATILLEECVVTAQQVGERWGLSRPLSQQAEMAFARGDYARTAALTQQCFAIAQEMGDPFSIARSLGILGYIARLEGHYAQATKLCNQGLKVAREVDDQYAINWLLCKKGDIAQDQAHYTQAITHYREGLLLALKGGNNVGAGWCLLRLAKVASAQGQFQIAAHLVGAAEARLNLNIDIDSVERAEHMNNKTTLRATLGEAVFAAIRTEGSALTSEQVLAELEHLAVDEAEKPRKENNPPPRRINLQGI